VDVTGGSIIDSKKNIARWRSEFFPTSGWRTRVHSERKRGAFANGADPTAKRKEAIAEIEFEATTSFRVVAEEWLEKREREGLGGVTIAKAKWLLDFV
jgi:hypothetical protein